MATAIPIYGNMQTTFGSTDMALAVINQAAGIIWTNIAAFVSQMQNYVAGMKKIPKGQNACIQQQYWMV